MYQNVRDLVDAHVAAERRHDPDAAAAFYADDCYYEHVALGVRHEGRAAVREQYAESWALIAGFDFSIEGSVAEGDDLVQWGRFTGSVGGNAVSVPFIARFETADGQIVGESVLYDVLTLADQAGVDVGAFRAGQPVRPA